MHAFSNDVESSNVLLLDGPTNHLDLESITSVNNGLMSFKGTVLFTTHDQEFAETVSNKVIVLNESGALEYQKTYADYIEEQINA